MPSVETVKGPVDVADLGQTLMHEHVFVLSPEIMQNFPEIWDEELRVKDGIDKLKKLRSRGVTTIVDPTVLGMGRYIPRVQRIADQVDINIVAATGIYTYHEAPYYFHYRGPGTLLDGPEVMADMFIKDIEEGIADTGVKAAILKCATDEDGLTPGVDRILRAVALAHHRTGVPITTHTHVGTRRGLDQQRVFREEGVDLSRIIIGHSGDSTDIGYLEELIGAGSYIGMDRFGIDVILPTADRVNTVVEMCERGHANRMVLSHDASCWLDWVDPLTDETRAQAAPNWHFTHISDDVIPELRRRGVTDDQITQMMVTNPRDIFSRQGAY